MSTFDFRCRLCHQVFEEWASIHDEVPHPHHCGRLAQRLYSPPGIHWGWPASQRGGGSGVEYDVALDRHITSERQRKEERAILAEELGKDLVPHPDALEASKLSESERDQAIAHTAEAIRDTTDSQRAEWFSNYTSEVAAKKRRDAGA